MASEASVQGQMDTLLWDQMKQNIMVTNVYGRGRKAYFIAVRKQKKE